MLTSQPIVDSTSVNDVETASLESCANPLCESSFTASGTPMQKRRFCSDRCRMDHWVLVRAGKLIIRLGEEQAWQVLNAAARKGE
jgi:hypothetical protein